MAFDTLATKESIAKTAAGLKERNVEPIIVATKAEALEKIKSLVPDGASIINGASRTLEEIGFVEYLKLGEHGWKNLHEDILAETDPAKQAVLRKQAAISDFYLGSVHALAETGEFIVGSNSGSQLPGIVYTSANLIFVVGTQKIVPTLMDAFARMQEHVVPLEDERLMGVYNAHTQLNKEVIFHGENARSGRKVYMILVEEKLGF